MLPQILSKDKFDDFVAFLMTGRRLAAPVAKGPGFAFAVIDSAEDVARIRMDYDITILPPKKYIMPQYETLLEFKGRGPDGVKQSVKAVPAVILGVHPYDLHGLACTDSAMCAQPQDANYATRRAATQIIGMNICREANDNQFQADMGTLDPPAEGWELFLTDLGDRYYVEIGSKAGEAMITGSGLFTAATSADHEARRKYDDAKQAAFKKKLPYNTKYLPEMLDSSYDSLLWDAVARRCFSCGTCTNVCPTCYCFDVADKLNLDATSGTRQRKWDSCQLEVFAEVAGGENFRETRSSRLRHRMFRKGKFVMERTGRLGCVGCGRCITHCVANISILETFQQIADEAEIETK